MKTLLIIDANLGQAHAYMAKTLLGTAARKAELEIIDNLSNAEMTIVLGNSIPNDSALNGKNVWQGDISRAAAYPGLSLSEAKGHVKSCTAPVAATAPANTSGLKRAVAVTVCPAGVAYTFMAAETIEAEAKKRGWWVKVETHGSVGAGNAVTPEEITATDLVTVAADVEMDLAKFAGKPMYRTSTGLTLKGTAQELGKAVVEATPYEPAGKTQTAATEGGEESTGAHRHLLTGVSYMLPMAAAGGLYIALSFTFGTETFKRPGTLAAMLMQISGGSVFALMVPVLASYIAFSIADRSDLTPDLIGGMLAVSTGSGLIGDIVAGFLAGYIVKLIDMQLKLPQSMEALKPILIIPLISSLVVGLVMIYLIGKPVAGILEGLARQLQTVGTTNAVLLGAILGGMMCTNMGGPVSKTAYAFGVGLLSTRTYDSVAAIMVTGMVPPLAIGLAIVVVHRKFDEVQQEGGKAALALGPCFISEGAIPFAARDPMRVLSCCIVDGALTDAISVAIDAKLMAPRDGLFVLLIPGTITPALGYLVAIIAGALMAGLAYAFLERPETQIVEKNA